MTKPVTDRKIVNEPEGLILGFEPSSTAIFLQVNREGSGETVAKPGAHLNHPGPPMLQEPHVLTHYITIETVVGVLS